MPMGGVADEEEEAGVPDHVMVSHIVAFGDEDVVVSGVAGTVVAVSVEADEEEEESVALVRLPGGVKKRRLDEDGGSLEVTEDLAVVKAPLGPRGSMERGGRVASGVLTGPRGHVGPRFGVGPIRGGQGCEGYGGRGRGRCNDPTIGSYNHYHLCPNGIPRGIQRWYGRVYFIQIAGKPRIRPRQQSSSFEVLY